MFVMTVKTDVYFRITGPSTSLLLRDCECSLSDQVGFLIGEKSSITTQTISDDEMKEEKIEITITINGTFLVGLPFVFCSPLGRIDEDSLKEILGSCEKKVVGWYSFRRNCNHSPSLREILLHKELCRVLSHISSQYFVFCIITTATNDRNATHSKRFTFSTFHHKRFHPVSVLVTNLGEPEDSLYRKSIALDGSFSHLQEVLSPLKDEGNSKIVMTTLHSRLNSHVEELEGRVARLQAEADHQIHRIDSSSFNCTVKADKSIAGTFTPQLLQDPGHAISTPATSPEISDGDSPPWQGWPDTITTPRSHSLTPRLKRAQHSRTHLSLGRQNTSSQGQ